MVKIKIKNTAASESNTANGIQSGDSTHHQGHAMYPVSFSPINNTVRSPQNPIPPDDLDSLMT
jgi:hypothetical protein